MMLLSFGVGERPLALVLGRFAQRGDVPDRAERPARMSRSPWNLVAASR